MTNKLILVSKLVFFNDRNELIEENLRIADYFNNEKVELAVVAQQATINILKRNLPKEHESKIKFINRSNETKNKIREFKDKGIIIGVIGIVEEDAIFSFNCKIPLFNPEALSSRVTVSEKVKKYGLPINDFQNVIDCFKADEIHKENYFQMSFGDSFRVISLNNANRFYRPEEEARVKQIFETNLKGNKSERDQRILLILLFHLINEVTTNSYYNKIDYWGTFPSSNPQNAATSISFLKEAVRVVIGGGPRRGPEILIRNQQMQSKHSSGATRLKTKSNSDFETLIVNPALKNNLKGKVICIIDDYITNGYSAEAAKHLLFAAGAKEVIFLSFGKFGKKYFSTNYVLDGDVYSKYTYEFIEEALYEGNIGKEIFYNPNNDSEILKFADLI
ncbi:phosphoribosyl transferase [Niallia circulans]|uniref:phosphoribosyltransferase n=1 Tax=Niallia circulans TaxID=1397 RepID=UPI0020400AE6|nr:phosphoribosyl transferase [Niallia circulans]MCM2983834.1 phosphoribosyl transferase [Niallia circulans]